MEVHPTRVNNKFSRKKKKDPTKWKTNIAKCLRYSSKGMPTRVCEHNTKALKCATLTMNNLSKIHRDFYKNSTKHDQNIILFKLCSIKETQERPNFKGKKKFKTNYSVFINKKRVPICQKNFLSIFGIKKYRVEYLMKKFYETGEFPREARGGDRKTEKYAEKKESVHRFIQSLQCIESHYCRKSKEAERKYLPLSDEPRMLRAQIADSLTFSSPPSFVMQNTGRSLSILGSVCAMLLAKQGSTTKEVSDISSRQSMNICRICFGGDSSERLVRPCACRGTVAAVHRVCLERWLLQACTSYCELCRHHYTVTRKHKWSLVRSVWEWARSGCGRALLADAWRATALGAASLLGTARALHAADAVLRAGARGGGGAALAANLFSSVLIGIIGALNGLLTTWILLKIQEHQASWRTWRDGTVHVRVALDEPASPPILSPTPSDGSFITVVCDGPEATVERSTNIADPFMVSLPYVPDP